MPLGFGNTTVVTGAYGRTYDSIDHAMEDWVAQKDFKVVSGPYCSIRDFDILDDIRFLQVQPRLSGSFPSKEEWELRQRNAAGAR